MKSLSGDQVLERYFLEARSKLLDIAAIFDRIDRGGASNAHEDKRRKLKSALTILAEEHNNRAELIQQLFSLEYDESWPVPRPK